MGGAISNLKMWTVRWSLDTHNNDESACDHRQPWSEDVKMWKRKERNNEREIIRDRRERKVTEVIDVECVRVRETEDGRRDIRRTIRALPGGGIRDG